MRPDSRMSRARFEHRARYRAYMASPAWWDRRRAWYLEELGRSGRVECAVCACEWTLVDDLHHVTYERLGEESHEDLMALCREHHELLHVAWDASRAWRKMPRPAATTGIVAALRAGVVAKP